MNEIAETETGAEVSSYARNEDDHNFDPRDEEIPRNSASYSFVTKFSPNLDLLSFYYSKPF